MSAKPVETLKEFSDGETELQGVFVCPADVKADEKLPVVLIWPEWRGVSEYAVARGRMLASQERYLCFVCDPYGKGVYAKDHAEAGKLVGVFFGADRAFTRQRGQANLTAALSHPNADEDQVVSIGYCFGGSVSLELARGGAKIRGAASFHGSLPTPHPEDAKNIKENGTKLLVCVGSVDPMIKQADCVGFLNEMDAAGVDYSFVSFGMTVHSFTVPEAQFPSFGAVYRPEADRRSWVYLVDFLKECFQPKGAAVQPQISQFTDGNLESVAGAAHIRT